MIMMKYDAVIVAAGSGSRMGLGYNKVYYRPDQETVLEKTIHVFDGDDDCAHIIVVTDTEDYREIIGEAAGKIVLTEGGNTRQQSVANGLALVREAHVMVHDGARPYLSKDLLQRLKQALQEDDAVCPMIPVKDTIKIVRDGYIQETIPRSLLFAAQTPQCFRTELLCACMEKAQRDGYTGTDDCDLVEHFSDIKIRAVEGEYRNIKLTTPEDL